MIDLTPTERSRYRGILLARLGELDARLHGIAEELLSHQSKDWQDLATEREQDEVLTSMGEEGRAEIRAILAALQRIDKGEYGDCVTCGEPISEARLILLPATPFCRHHAP